MQTELMIQAVHSFLDAEVMLEQRRTEEGDLNRECETFERAKQQLSDSMSKASNDPSAQSLVSEAQAYLAATTAFEEVRKLSLAGTEMAGPARRLEQAQQSLQEMLNRYAHDEAERLKDSAVHAKRVLVGVDGSPASEWAVDAAGRLALALRATIKMIYVRPVRVEEDMERLRIESGSADSDLRLGELLLREGQLRLPARLESSVIQRWGDPASEIVGAARRWGADFIVVGTRGRGRVSRFMLGSTADSIVRLAPCPVITVAHPSASTASTLAQPFETSGRAVLAI